MIYCPSCQDTKEEDDRTKVVPRICDDCIKYRDTSHEHSEEDIQKEIQKNLK